MILDKECRSRPHLPGWCISGGSGPTDDELRRQIRARLSEARLPAVDGVSKSHRGTSRPCIVCRRAIDPTQVERELDGVGVVMIAHEACYKLWREESVAARATGGSDQRAMDNMPDDHESFAEGQGVILGRLQARLPDRIIVGDLALFLRSGTKCDHAIGTALRVTYTQHDGIKVAQQVDLAAW